MVKRTIQKFDPAEALLVWYDQSRRDLPWREDNPEPYHVWLSEVMLQQTTVVTVKPRFAKFLERWPTIKELAAAPLDDVLHEWQGLGYYARARNLHKCARAITQDHKGVFPSNEAALLSLPGIGDYTAAAIAAIAFGQTTAPVDGNIIRVISRLAGLEQIMPAGKQAVQNLVREYVPSHRPGDFAQSMMDLGAMVCTPRSPKCQQCPWQENCQALSMGTPDEFPRKKPKKQKPTRYGTVFWLVDDRGGVLLRRRPEKGLLGGMMEFPSSDWTQGHKENDFLKFAPVENITWEKVPGKVRHTFTHFHLELEIVRGGHSDNSNAIWALPEEFPDYALPTVMKKIVDLVQETKLISA